MLTQAFTKQVQKHIHYKVTKSMHTDTVETAAVSSGQSSLLMMQLVPSDAGLACCLVTW